MGEWVRGDGTGKRGMCAAYSILVYVTRQNISVNKNARPHIIRRSDLKQVAAAACAPLVPYRDKVEEQLLHHL